MRRVLIAGAALAIARAAAADPIPCAEDDGAPLFTRSSRALGADPPAPELVIHASGAWRRTAHGRGGRVDVELGCLDPMRLGELRRTLGKARFRTTMPRITCRAMPIEHVVYASPARGVKAEVDEPCREVLDPGTELLAECADVVTMWAKTDDEVRAICRADDAIPR